MGYANDNHIPYVAIIGETELEKSAVTLKCMETGEQEELTIQQIIDKLK